MNNEKTEADGSIDFEEKTTELEKELEQFQNQYQNLRQKMEDIGEAKQNIEQKVDIEASDIDFKALEAFVKDEYWLLNEIGEEEYEVWIPNFMDVQAGVLDRQVGGYNVFILDQTTKLISGIPEFLEDQVSLDTEQKFKVKEDLLEFEEEKKDLVEEELDEYVEEVKDDKATIKQDKGHALVRDLLNRGEMPFTPAPVNSGDLRESQTKHELRLYQKTAFQEWLQHGAITVCFMTGAGKTHVGIEALDRLKYNARNMRKAVVVYSRITAKQWKNKIEEFAPRLNPVIMSGKKGFEPEKEDDIVEIYTYQGMDKLESLINSGYEYGLIEFDEGDFLPAKTFSVASTFPIKYRMGLTASPVRSQENPNDVFALCGKPVGMDWKDTLAQMEQEMFPVNIHVVSTDSDKIDRAKEVRSTKKTTLFFVESIEFGQTLSTALDLEFIHGEHRNQKEKIEDAIEKDNAVVVSRIANRGMSIENVERLVEVDNRGDSRREIIQRLGRLFHGQGEQADVIYTAGEANKYEERFYALIEKGFQINDVDNALEMPDLGSKGSVDITPEQLTEKQNKEEASRKPEIDVTPSKIRDYEDPVEMLEDERIKEIVKEAIEEGQLKNSVLKSSIIAIASSGEEGLTNKEIAETVNMPNRSNKYLFTKPFKDKKLIKKNEENSKKHVLNFEDVGEIIENHTEQKRRKQRISELEDELSL